MGAQEVGIDHTDGLHERKAGHRPHELKTGLLQFPRHCLRLGALFRDILHDLGIDIFCGLKAPNEIR